MPRLLILRSSFLLILSYPPFDLGWLAWGAFVPWLLSLEKATPRQAFLRSTVVGLLFFGGTIWWIGHVTIPGLVLLVAYLALFFGAWGWLANRFVVRGSWFVMLGLAGAWVLLEILRSILLTGFGWNLLAHTQWNWIPIIQIADVASVYGVSFLVALVNIAVWQAVRGQKLCLLLSVLCLLSVWSYGTLRLRQLSDPSFPSFTVAVVQGNIPQTQKWDEAFAEAIWKRYEWLTQEAAKSRPDLILWPETAVPDYLEDPGVSARVTRIASEVKVPLLVGGPFGVDSGDVFNSAALIDPEKGIVERYDKLHLVPFGEYVPLGPLLSWLRRFILMGDFSPGHRWTVFSLPVIARSGATNQSLPSFSVLICFEDLFPGLARRFVREGARWLVVITNDAWFGRSAASLQHTQCSVFRAIENRVWVVRAANTGWSGFIDPAGRRLPPPHQVPRFEPGVAAATLER